MQGDLIKHCGQGLGIEQSIANSLAHWSIEIRFLSLPEILA